MKLSTVLSTLLLALPTAVLHSQSATALADADLCSDAVATRTDRAKGALADAARGAQGARATFLRGCDQVVAGRIDPAVASLEAAVRADPNNAVYHFWLGRTYGEQAGTASKVRLPRIAGRAKAALERAVQLAPDYLDGREVLMMYYLQAPGIAGGSVEKAREQGREIARRSPYRGAVSLVQVARKDKDPDAVVRALEASIEQFPDSVGPYIAAISTFAEQKNWTRAWEIVDRLERARPAFPVARYTFGRVAALSGQRLDPSLTGARQALAKLGS